MFLMPTLKANVSFLLIHRELDILKLFKQISKQAKSMRNTIITFESLYNNLVDSVINPVFETDNPRSPLIPH